MENRVLRAKEYLQNYIKCDKIKTLIFHENKIERSNTIWKIRKYAGEVEKF